MKRQSGLGQGLSALIPDKEENLYKQEDSNTFNKSEPNENGELVWLKVEELKTNPQQPRSSFNDKQQEELTESIKKLNWTRSSAG